MFPVKAWWLIYLHRNTHIHIPVFMCCRERRDSWGERRTCKPTTKKMWRFSTWNLRMSRGFPAFFRQFWLHLRKNLRKNLQIKWGRDTQTSRLDPALIQDQGDFSRLTLKGSHFTSGETFLCHKPKKIFTKMYLQWETLFSRYKVHFRAGVSSGSTWLVSVCVGHIYTSHYKCYMFGRQSYNHELTGISESTVNLFFLMFICVLVVDKYINKHLKVFPSVCQFYTQELKWHFYEIVNV